MIDILDSIDYSDTQLKIQFQEVLKLSKKNKKVVVLFLEAIIEKDRVEGLG